MTARLGRPVFVVFEGLDGTGRLLLRSDTGQEITHTIPSRLVGGESVVLAGLTKPQGNSVKAAMICWCVMGDPSGQTTVEQYIAVR